MKEHFYNLKEMDIRMKTNDVASSRTLVMKFGGTSVGSIDAIAQVVEIVSETRNGWPRVVVVVAGLGIIFWRFGRR